MPLVIEESGRSNSPELIHAPYNYKATTFSALESGGDSDCKLPCHRSLSSPIKPDVQFSASAFEIFLTSDCLTIS
jgi:hypothetical protein